MTAELSTSPAEPPVTLIRAASWAAVWNPALQRHEAANDIDIAFADKRIVHVGPDWRGSAARVIEGRGMAVLPGLVNLHAHPALEPIFRGLREDHGRPEMYMTGLHERSQAFRPAPEDMAAPDEVAYAEMLQCGVTTVCDQIWPFPGWLDTLSRSGLRGFAAPGFSSGRWRLEGPFRLAYDWDIPAGEERFASAMALIDEAIAHPSGRLSGVICPLQIDTCSEDLLRAAQAEAERRDLPITVHCAQSVNEFQEMVRRHGMTPVQWAHHLGLLSPRMTLGHAIFVDHHSWLSHWTRDDLRLLAETGTSVAHCPSPFARYGHALEDFGRYRAAGVNIGIGTDVAPHNLIEEMRLAMVVARITGRDIRAADPGAVFEAATVGGARALGRDDIGRLAPGAMADLVIVDLDHPLMRPAPDPLRALLWSAAERAVREVYVDGRQVVANGRVLTLDPEAALDHLEAAQARMLKRTPLMDFRGRDALSIMPSSLPPSAPDRSF